MYTCLRKSTILKWLGLRVSVTRQNETGSLCHDYRITEERIRQVYILSGIQINTLSSHEKRMECGEKEL